MIRPGTLAPMNCHFTTTKQHSTVNGVEVVKLVIPEGLEVTSAHPFKRNLDVGALERLIGGSICIRDEKLYKQMSGYVPMFEDFLTYGGMSVPAMEAITAGLDEDMISELDRRNIPVTTPAGGLVTALYVCSGVRDMELARLAVSHRVSTLSQANYVIGSPDRLHRNHHLIGGLE